MALIKCPECGKDVSDTISQCIHCGFVLKKAAPAAPIVDPTVATTYKVVLTNAGHNKISVIKFVREMTNLNLASAKDLVDNAPKTIHKEFSYQEAITCVKEIERLGGKAELATGNSTDAQIPQSKPEQNVRTCQNCIYRSKDYRGYVCTREENATVKGLFNKYLEYRLVKDDSSCGLFVEGFKK